MRWAEGVAHGLLLKHFHFSFFLSADPLRSLSALGLSGKAVTSRSVLLLDAGE